MAVNVYLSEVQIVHLPVICCSLVCGAVILYQICAED